MLGLLALSRIHEALCSTDKQAAFDCRVKEMVQDETFLLVTLPIFTDLKNTDRLSNKPFLIWLLTTPPHFKNVATLPCNLSLIAFF